ncbi:uncharacterized protein [Oscarella lobularis]|uniref:uncharacterized protein n=1 Tax=Oscarella lobularis TaxID=121494 RepID=UPI0033144B81
MGVLEIQSRIWTCRQAYTTVSCHCGVIVREGNDVLSIDQCFWQQRDPQSKIRNIPPRVRKHSKGSLQEGFGVYKNPSGTQFKIQLPSGAAIKVDASFWGMSVYVRVSEEDHGKTKGLCGNNNGDKSDDMIGSDEVMYAKDPGSIAKKAFIDTWRVSEKENLFDSSVVEGLEEGGNTDIENNPTINKFCACEGPTKSILSACPNRPIVIQAKAFAGNQWTEVGQDLRSKRAVAGPDDVPTDEDDVDDDYDFVFDPTAEPPVFRFPTPNNITERAAVDECSRVLTASPVAKACIEDGVINTISNDTIASCVEDIKLSDDLSTASAYLDSVLQQCEESLANDVDYWKPNITITNDTSVDASQIFLAQPSLPPIIASSVCPRDCSNRGQCVNSTCICETNFTGPDCSIDSNAAPTLITFTNDGLCDRRLKPCRTAFVVGEGFLNNENLSCIVERQETGEEFQVFSQFQSIYEVTCALPLSRVQPEESVEVETEPVDHLSVRVTVDGRVFSNALAYSAFDSVCYDCPEAGSCVRKNNTCLIRGHCFADREANPLDWCQQCLPQANETAFSERTDNENPTITSDGALSLLRGYEFQFNLSVNDPENRSVQFEVVDFDGNAFNFSGDGLWTWFIPHNASRNETYNVSFIAVDECNGTSEAYSPEIRLVDCPCTSNGRCVLKEGSQPGSGEFECLCNFGFNGSLCEIDLNYCVSNPCINNGTCILDGNGFYCNCSDEFEGDLCEIEKPSLKWNDCSMYGCNKPSVPSSCLESRWLYNFAEQSLTVEIKRPINGNESYWIGFGLSTNTSDRTLVDWSVVYFDQLDGSLHVRDKVSSIDRKSTVYLNHSKVFKAEEWIINGTMHVVITRNLSSSNLEDVENFLVGNAFFILASGLHNASSSDFHVSYQFSSPTIINFRTRCLGCSDLESIVNSHPIEYSDNFLSDGVIATYSCNGTHLLLGNQSRQCVSGIWTGAEPRCVKPCGDPVVPANGSANIAFVQGSDLILGSDVTFRCEDGLEVCGKNQLTCQADGEWDYPYPDCKLFCNVQNITVDDSDVPINLQYTTAGSVLWLFPESIVLNTGKLGDEGWKSVIVCLKGMRNSSSSDEEIVHDKQLAINSSRVSEADFSPSGHANSSSVSFQLDRVIYTFNRYGKLNISAFLFTLAYKDSSPTDYLERNLTVFVVDIYDRKSSKVHITVQHSAINDSSPVLTPNHQAINFTESEGPITLFQKPLEIFDADHETLEFSNGFCSLTAVAVEDSSYLPERDILRADCPYFTTNYYTVNGTLTITGSNNSQAYERCFNSLEYDFLGEVSPLIRRDVKCSLSDGIHVGIATIRINLFNVNDPPSLKINGNATERSETYVQYGNPVAVFESLAISDEDSFIQKARVKALGLHRNAQQNERNDSVVFSTESSKLEIAIVESDEEVEWNVTGNATTKEYQSFFRGLLFQSSDEKPFRLTSEDRLFTLQVFDNELSSNVIQTMVTVISVNDAPILQFNPESNPYAFPTSESLVSFATFRKGLPLMVFPNTTTLEDVDGTNLRQFTCLLQNATDGVLEIIGVNETLTTLYNLSVDLNRSESDTVTLIINGLASVRNYRSAVMSIYYFHNDQSLLTPGNRVIECAATDDENATSAIAQVIIGFNYCAMDPCVHGDCTSNERGFVCSCFNGHYGELCNISQTIANTTWRSCDMEGSEAGSYSVTMTERWSYNPNKSVLTTEIKRSVGDFWIGIGLSVNGTMCNSDIVTAFFSLRDGSLQVQKRKASFYGEPMIIANDTTILDSDATTVNGEMIFIIRQNIDYVANGSIHIILATGKLVDNNVSHGEIFYHVNSRWSSPSPVNFNDCLGCSLLEKPHDFYAIKYSDTIHYRGTTATHPCYENGVFVGEKWRECTDSAIWTGSNLTCICPLPDASFMGNVSVRTSGTKSIFGCKKNLTACGETELTCLEGGLWDLPFPRCRLFCSVQVLHFGSPNFLQDITLQYSAPNTILWLIPNPHKFVSGDLGNNGWESVQVTLSGVVNIHSDIETITEARSAALNLGRVSEQELLSNGKPSNNVAPLGDDTLVYTFSRTENLDLNVFLSALAYVHQNPSDYLIRNVSLIVTDVYKETSPAISVAIQHIGQNENAPIIFNTRDIPLQFSEGDHHSVNVFQYNLTISDADNVLFHKLEFAHCVIVSAPSSSFDANKEYIFANNCRALNISRKNDTGDLWIRGKAAPEDYADCLNSLYYFHGGEIFPSLYRRISCTVSDGIHEASTSVKVDLVNINDRPSLTFPHEANTSIIQYRQYEPPVNVFEGGRILDPDSDFLTMALIQIIVSDDQNVDLSGEIILPNSNVGQVDVDLEQTQNALMINITGNASASFYESYLDSIQFYNPETKPFNLSSASRVFTVKVFDGEMWSNSLTSTVDVIPINDAPALRFFPENFSGSNQIVFAEDSHPKFIAPNTTTLIDVDSTKMSRLQCHMDGALDGSFEGLRIDSGLAQEDNVSYEISQRNAETFVVLANGLAETDYYLNIIRSVEYLNNKEEVTAGDRRFRCNVTDSGGETSETAMIIIVVKNVNDGIDVNLDASSLSITFREGQLRGAYVIPDPHRLSVSDNENHRLRKVSFELITVPSGYVDESEFIFIVKNVPSNLKMTFENTEVSKKLIFEGNASIAVLTELARQVLYFSQEDEPTLFLPNSNYPIKRYVVIRFYDTGTPSATTELRVKINLRSTNDHAPEIVVKPDGNQCVTTKLRTRRSAEKHSEYKMISKQLEVADVHTGNGRLGQHGSYICIRFSDETNLPPVAREKELAQILHFTPSIVNELPHFGLWQSNDTLTIVFPVGARKNSMVPLLEAGFSFYAQQRNGLCVPEIDCVANVCSSGGNSCPVTGEYTFEPITKLKEGGSAPDSTG